MVDKRSILITGCSSGIGLHTALHLQQKNYQVFATARKEKDVELLLAKGLTAHLLDVTDVESIDTALDWVLKHTNGTLFALFNNAGYGQPGAVEDLSIDVLREQFETNVFGLHHLTCRVLPIMRKQGYGRIVQNSSVLGFACMPYRGAYNASKFAVEGLTDTLRLELKSSNIQVSLVEPGPIATQFRANALIKMRQHIDIENSVHASDYQTQLSRLGKEKVTNMFTLEPHAVTRKVVDALESNSAKPRYYVTFPTYLFGFLKRLLPTKWLDALLMKG